MHKNFKYCLREKIKRLPLTFFLFILLLLFVFHILFYEPGLKIIFIGFLFLLIMLLVPLLFSFRALSYILRIRNSKLSSKIKFQLNFDFKVAFIEEIVFRFFPIFFILSLRLNVHYNLLLVSILTAVFSLLHFVDNKRNIIIKLEFFISFFAIGAYYLFYHEIIVPIIFHWLRNGLISIYMIKKTIDRELFRSND